MESKDPINEQRKTHEISAGSTGGETSVGVTVLADRIFVVLTESQFVLVELPVVDVVVTRIIVKVSVFRKKE